MNAATKNATVPVEDLHRILAVWATIARRHSDRSVADAYGACANDLAAVIKAAS